MKKEKCKTKITISMKSQHNNQPVFARVIIFIGYSINFFLTYAHPKFVYKLDISNHKTALNKKNVNNLFN